MDSFFDVFHKVGFQQLVNIFIDPNLFRSNQQNTDKILLDDESDEDQDSESSNSDKTFSYDERSSDKKFGGMDFESGRNVDQFDMSKTGNGDRNQAGTKEVISPTKNQLPVSSINFEFDGSKERSPKMIDENSDVKLSNNYESSKLSNNFETSKSTLTNNSSNDTLLNEPKVETNSTDSYVDNEKIDTSLFDISDDNFDNGDAMTWRPMRLSANGILRMDASEVISTSNAETGETIVTVLESDSWIPNGGPIMKERD